VNGDQPALKAPYLLAGEEEEEEQGTLSSFVDIDIEGLVTEFPATQRLSNFVVKSGKPI